MHSFFKNLSPRERGFFCCIYSLYVYIRGNREDEVFYMLGYVMTITISANESNAVIEKKISTLLQQRKTKKRREGSVDARDSRKE